MWGHMVATVADVVVWWALGEVVAVAAWWVWCEVVAW